MTHFVARHGNSGRAFDQILVEPGCSATSVGDVVKNRNNTDPSDFSDAGRVVCNSRPLLLCDVVFLIQLDDRS